MEKSDKVDTVETVEPERGDAASRPGESPLSSHSSSPHSGPADSVPDDLFGLSLDPALAELADEFSRRLLAGETVDVDQLVAAHPEQADAFKKHHAPLARARRARSGRQRRRARPAGDGSTGRPRGGSLPTFTSSARSAGAAWGSCTRPARPPSAAGSP